MSIIPSLFPSCCTNGSSPNLFVPSRDFSGCTSTMSKLTGFDSLRIGERAFLDVTIDAADLVGVGGAGRMGRERLGCTGITQGPRSLKAVARLPPVPLRCNLLELSAIMMRGSRRELKPHISIQHRMFYPEFHIEFHVSYERTDSSFTNKLMTKLSLVEFYILCYL